MWRINMESDLALIIETPSFKKTPPFGALLRNEK